MDAILNFGLTLFGSAFASAAFFWLRWRKRISDVCYEKIAQDRMKEERRLKRLSTKKRNILNKIEARAQVRLERDQAKIEDLDEREERNVHLESKLGERASEQEERIADMELRRGEVSSFKSQVKSLKRILKSRRKSIRDNLEQKAQMSSLEAVQFHQDQICAQVNVEVQQKAQRKIVEAEAYRDTRANELISLGRQRYYDPSPAEKMLTYVDLPRSEKQKSLFLTENSEQLSMLEEVTKVSFILDSPESNRLQLRNSPETFSREVARFAYQRWLNGGQLNENALKTHYKKAKQTLEKEARQAGMTAAERLELRDIHPEILYLVGKLLFRTSYTQNQWQHAIEASELCGMMAEELGMNATIARRATLLHDIGKVLWAETEAVGSHAVSGAAFAREFGEVPEIVHPIGAHHHDEQPASALAFLVIAADTLSGARPGARRESSEAFSQHVAQLDDLCHQVDGLRQHMIIQGGRELRLQVYPQQYSDFDLQELSQEMASVIEDECTFPGQIKVTALRELITTSVAKAKYRDQNKAQSPKAINNKRSPYTWGGEKGDLGI